MIDVGRNKFLDVEWEPGLRELKEERKLNKEVSYLRNLSISGWGPTVQWILL